MRSIATHKLQPAGFKRLLLMLFILTACPSQHGLATAYKWVDEDGNTHYTQTPPPGDRPSEAIGAPPPGTDPEAARSEIKALTERADRLQAERTEKAEKRRQQLAEEAERETLCQEARASRASYERPRVNQVMEDGSRRIMGEEERQAGLARARTLIGRFCGAD